MAEPIIIARIIIKAAGFVKDNWKTLLPAFLALLLFPYFIYITVTNILLPQIDKGMLGTYIEASEKNQISLSVLLSYDTIRYFNNMSKADPDESVFDFLVIDWRVYEVEEVTKRREEVENEENIVDEFTVLSEDIEIEMAVEKMEQVAIEIRQKWPAVQGIVLIQRIGTLYPGTPTIAIACSAAHRDTGVFEAARYGIDRLKEIVPIWKKEVSKTEEAWVEGKYIPEKGD